MRAYVLTFALLASAFCACAQGLERVLPERVGMSGARLAWADSAIQRSIAAGHIPGAVLAVVKNGKMAYLKAYGHRSLVPRREKMTTNTIFDLASCSKPVATAMSVMVLLEQGKIRLDDAVATHIPGFASWVSDDGKQRATIRVRHLLTHTSGLPPYAPVDEVRARYGANCPDSLIKYIGSWRRDFKPATAFQYSCLNYITLQHVVEAAGGMSLRDFSRRHVFAPLGMAHTDYIPCEPDGKDGFKASALPVWADGKGSWQSLVAPTERIEGDRVWRGLVHDPLARVINGGVSGNAGLFSTADDLALLCAALLNGGELHGTRILSPATVRLMTTLPRGLEKFGRTPGWDVSSPYASHVGDLLGHSTYGHTGFTGTMINIDPDNRLAVILLTNSVHPGGGTNVSRLRALVSNAVASAVTGDSRTAHYLDRMEEFDRRQEINGKSVVMLGNSLTENGGDWGKRLGMKNVVNRGIIGDDVPGINSRLHQILPHRPAAIVLMEGINDLSHQLSCAEIANSVATTINLIRRGSPGTRVVLQSMLPINEAFGRYKRLDGKTDSVAAINKRLEALAKKKGVDFVDLYPLFREKGSQSLRRELTSDGLHLNAEGYAIWAEELARHLK